MSRALTTITVGLLTGALTLASGAARAQDNYPSRGITIVVAFAAGGTSDIIGRLLAYKLAEYTGVSAIVENVPGAANTIGTEKVARSAPDGYTLYLASSTPFATNPNLYSKLRYSLDDFEPITVVARVPLALDVRPDFPASSVKEFVDYAKRKPGGVTIATPGRGSVGDIVNGMARGILDIAITDVPYRGSTPAVTDVLKGVVDAYFDAISSTLPLYHAEKLKVLGDHRETALSRGAECAHAAGARLPGLHARERVRGAGAERNAASDRRAVERFAATRIRRSQVPRDLAGSGCHPGARDAGRNEKSDSRGLRVERADDQTFQDSAGRVTARPFVIARGGMRCGHRLARGSMA